MVSSILPINCSQDFLTFNKMVSALTLFPPTLHRGAFCQFPFRWVHYYGSNESTGKETGKTHLCALGRISPLMWQHVVGIGLKKSYCTINDFKAWTKSYILINRFHVSTPNFFSCYLVSSICNLFLEILSNFCSLFQNECTLRWKK